MPYSGILMQSSRISGAFLLAGWVIRKLLCHLTAPQGAFILIRRRIHLRRRFLILRKVLKHEL